MTKAKVIWRGTEKELDELFDAIGHHSTCSDYGNPAYDHLGKLEDCDFGSDEHGDRECPAHSLMADQHILDGLLWLRRLIHMKHANRRDHVVEVSEVWQRGG